MLPTLFVVPLFFMNFPENSGTAEAALLKKHVRLLQAFNVLMSEIIFQVLNHQFWFWWSSPWQVKLHVPL